MPVREWPGGAGRVERQLRPMPNAAVLLQLNGQIGIADIALQFGEQFRQRLRVVINVRTVHGTATQPLIRDPPPVFNPHRGLAARYGHLRRDGVPNHIRQGTVEQRMVKSLCFFVQSFVVLVQIGDNRARVREPVVVHVAQPVFHLVLAHIAAEPHVHSTVAVTVREMPAEREDDFGFLSGL